MQLKIFLQVISSPTLGSNPCPLLQKREISTTGPPRKVSEKLHFKKLLIMVFWKDFLYIIIKDTYRKREGNNIWISIICYNYYGQGDKGEQRCCCLL